MTEVNRAEDKLWSSRFSSALGAEALAYTASIAADRRMTEHDILGSIAHAVMLGRCKIVAHENVVEILRGLLAIRERFQSGAEQLRVEWEDVHLNIEELLRAEIGADSAGRLHTARSRNDQVVTDARLYMREAATELFGRVITLCGALLGLAARSEKVTILAYTHSQAAQPILAPFWCLAHVEALYRDMGRLLDAIWTIDQNPLGSAAVAGTPFPVDRQFTTQLLGFRSVMRNAMDATSSRDSFVQLADALALTGLHLSRMCEEIVWWNSNEFRLLTISDSLATGSSIMPQKKNPVIAELARGKVGGMIAAAFELHMIIKNVPLGYSCDLQQDKPILWRVIDTSLDTLQILALHVEGMAFDPDRGRELCSRSFSSATELANWLVVDRDFPFRNAYHIGGEIVAALERQGLGFDAIDAVCLILRERGIECEADVIAQVLDPNRVVDRQSSYGGTASGQVSDEMAVLTELLATAEDRKRNLAEHYSQVRSNLVACAGAIVAGNTLENCVQEWNRCAAKYPTELFQRLT